MACYGSGKEPPGYNEIRPRTEQPTKTTTCNHLELSLFGSNHIVVNLPGR
jgi:hypothetical protein